MKFHAWLKRADAILAADTFDAAAALSLVREIRNQSGPGPIGFAAGQALGSLQAADRRVPSKWQTAIAKQRFELVRKALAHRASRA